MKRNLLASPGMVRTGNGCCMRLLHRPQTEKLNTADVGQLPRRCPLPLVLRLLDDMSIFALDLASALGNSWEGDYMGSNRVPSKRDPPMCPKRAAPHNFRATGGLGRHKKRCCMVQGCIHFSDESLAGASWFQGF